MSYVANTQTNLTKFCVSAFVCLLAISSFCNLQAQPQDSLAVSIQNIFTDGVSLRGYTANYPYPILSIISVLDTSDHPVRGLADTLKWLGPNDIANNGRPISKIWQPLFDYKSDEASAIEASNLYNLRSCSDSLQPHFIAGVPATTMLLMDVSGSVYDIDSDLVNVREGIKSFIADMRPEDRAGVIQFNCEFKHLAPTNDRDSLNAFVDSARRGDWTPLYEAIINAIDSIKDESSLLRSIVVYTDGKNNLPNDTTKCPQILREQLTEDSVIVEANKFRIPVYVIALGNGTSDPILKKIADATGGQFYKSDNGSDFTDKYRQISDIIQNYYVMAHQSPQPCESGFLRTVDITVNDSTAAGIRAGSERAEYEATGPPPLYDLELTMSADKECVFEGDVINFFLTIKNQGPDPAFNICLKDSLSEYLRPDRALSWNLVSLGAMETFEVSFSATVDAALPDSTKELLNFARVIADCDSDSVSLRLCVKPKEYDLSIAKSGDVDTVTLGEIITYTIAITNLGPNTADSLSVCDTIPELLIPLDFDGEFDGNVLCWSHLNPLAVGDTLFIPYTARVDNQLPNSPDTLINTARVFAKNDTNPSNNTARDTVIVTVPEQPECDLAIQKSADQDTVKSSEIITYTITITNLGPNQADSISVCDTLPGFATHVNGGLAKCWQIQTLAPNSDTTIVFEALVGDPLSDSPVMLINTASVFAQCDTNPTNNTARDTVIVTPQPIQQPNCDLSIQKSSDEDTVTIGEKITYNLTITNVGPDTADGITVCDTLPGFAAHANGGSVMCWPIQTLAPNSDTTIVFEAIVGDPLSDSPVMLINTASVFSQCDNIPANNMARDTVVVVPPEPPARCDVAIEKTTDKDTVRTGEIITYNLTIRNLGPNTCDGIAVCDTLPDFITLVNGGMVMCWQIQTLTPNSDTTIVFQATVGDPSSNSAVELINIARVVAENDTSPSNNAASAKVVWLPPTPCADLSISISTDKDSVKIGEEFVGTIIISNLGQIPATRVRLEVTGSECISLLDFVSPGEFGTLTVGETKTVSFRAELTCSPPNNAPAVIEACVSSDACDDDDSNNCAEIGIPFKLILEDCNLFRLDFNVFQPERGPLGINFELSESRVIQVDVYDITSYHITRIAETTFPAGQNRFEWNGLAANGQRVGSGVYVISLRSGNLLCWKKVILVR